MSKAKDFLIETALSENSLPGAHNYRMGPVDAVPSADDVDVNIFDLANKKVWDRVAAFVGSIGMSDYRDPTTAIAKLREKLGYVGLTLPPFRVGEGKWCVKCKRFGGVTRKNEDGSLVVNDDSVRHANHKFAGAELASGKLDVKSEDKDGVWICFDIGKTPVSSYSVQAKMVSAPEAGYTSI